MFCVLLNSRAARNEPQWNIKGLVPLLWRLNVKAEGTLYATTSGDTIKPSAKMHKYNQWH